MFQIAMYDDDLQLSLGIKVHFDPDQLFFNKIVTGLGVYDVCGLSVCVNYATPKQNWVDPSWDFACSIMVDQDGRKGWANVPCDQQFEVLCQILSQKGEEHQQVEYEFLCQMCFWDGK